MPHLGYDETLVVAGPGGHERGEDLVLLFPQVPARRLLLRAAPPHRFRTNIKAIARVRNAGPYSALAGNARSSRAS